MDTLFGLSKYRSDFPSNKDLYCLPHQNEVFTSAKMEICTLRSDVQFANDTRQSFPDNSMALLLVFVDDVFRSEISKLPHSHVFWVAYKNMFLHCSTAILLEKDFEKSTHTS